METPIPENQRPTFVSTPDEELSEGEAYQYEVITTDDNPDDRLTILKIEGPAWLELIDGGDRTAVLQCIPEGCGGEGTYPIVLQVNDGKEVESQSFTLVVKASTPPLIETEPVTSATTG